MTINSDDRLLVAFIGPVERDLPRQVREADQAGKEIFSSLKLNPNKGSFGFALMPEGIKAHTSYQLPRAAKQINGEMGKGNVTYVSYSCLPERPTASLMFDWSATFDAGVFPRIPLFLCQFAVRTNLLSCPEESAVSDLIESLSRRR